MTLLKRALLNLLILLLCINGDASDRLSFFDGVLEVPRVGSFFRLQKLLFLELPERDTSSDLPFPEEQSDFDTSFTFPFLVRNKG